MPAISETDWLHSKLASSTRTIHLIARTTARTRSRQSLASIAELVAEAEHFGVVVGIEAVCIARRIDAAEDVDGCWMPSRPPTSRWSSIR